MPSPTHTPLQKRKLTELAALQKQAADAMERRDRLIVQLYDGGHGVGPTEIAKAAGVTRGRVHQVLREHAQTKG